MADLPTICGVCGKRVLISEFADLSAVACRECGGELKREASDALSAPTVAAEPRLQMVRRSPGQAVNLRGEPIAPKPSFVLSERVIPKTALDEPDADRPSRRWLGIVAGLAGLAIMVGPQTVADYWPEVHAAYLYARYGMLAVLWAMVAIDAWREGSGQGVLTTLIPPYAFLYAALRTEFVWLKALVFCGALMLAAELHFLREDAMIREAQRSIARGIESVEGRIQRAGDPLPR